VDVDEVIDLQIFQQTIFSEAVEKASETHSNVKPSFFPVLYAISIGAVRVGGVASLVGLTQQGAGKTIKNLTNFGYVDNIPDPKDNRARILENTKAGNELLKIFAAVCDDWGY